MWRGKTVAVIFPTYNEKDSIRAAAFDFMQMAWPTKSSS